MMQQHSIFDIIPLALFVLLVLCGIILSVEAGFRLGRLRSREKMIERPETVSSLVAAALGLVAFLLAFTYSIAAHRFESKRQTLNQEVNAIGTTYLRADFLTPPQRDQTKQLLREYVEARLSATEPGRLQDAIRTSEEIHLKLWAAGLAGISNQPVTPIQGLYVQSLNELIDLHNLRVIVGLQSRIPDSIWIVLLTVIVIAFATTGYHSGMMKTCRCPLSPVIAILFALVLGLVMDLERSMEGTLRVSKRPLEDLKLQIGK